MLKLIIGDEKGEVQSATIPVRWCVDEATLKNLNRKGVLNPYVLLVVAAAGRDGNEEKYYETSRYIAPLEQLVEHVQFQGPRVNRIYAIIVWSDAKDCKKDLWRRFISRVDVYYRTDILNYDGTLMDNYKQGEFAEVDVSIPEELFAKAYPAWEQKWVNFWFETKPKDQCQYRRRRILAYTIQPPAVLLWVLFKKILSRWIAAALLIALGFWFLPTDRDDNLHWNPKKWTPILNLKPLFRLWRMSFSDLFSEDYKYILESWDDTDLINGIVFLLSSVYVMMVVAVCAIIFLTVRKIFRKVISVLGPIIRATGKIFSKIPWDKKVGEMLGETPWLKRKKDRISERAEEGARRVRAQEILVERTALYQALLCENAEEIEPIKVVPFRQQIRLRYHDLKAKICKPLPRW